MCTILLGNENASNIEPRVAKSDIDVYKMVRVNPDGKTWSGAFREEYTAPFNKKLVETGKFPFTTPYNNAEIGSGMFHSVASINCLKGRLLYSRRAVVKAIIPKGSVYYRSKVGMDIASQEIIVTDKVVAADGLAAEKIRERPDLIELVEFNGKYYIHIADKEHGILLGMTRCLGGGWSDVYERCKEKRIRMGNSDDWSLICKYQAEIGRASDVLWEQRYDADNLMQNYWTSTKYTEHSHAYFVYGVGNLHMIPYRDYACVREVLQCPPSTDTSDKAWNVVLGNAFFAFHK